MPDTREETWEACWSAIADAAWPEKGATRAEVLELLLAVRPAALDATPDPVVAALDRIDRLPRITLAHGWANHRSDFVAADAVDRIIAAARAEHTTEADK